MTFQGSVITEQGVTFAIVVVQMHVIDNPSESQKAIAAFRPLFPGIPIILMAQDYMGTPFYCGTENITNFLSSVPMDLIPWQEYTI